MLKRTGMIATNAVAPATGKFKHKGFKVGHGIPSKGGETHNYIITESDRKGGVQND